MCTLLVIPVTIWIAEQLAHTGQITINTESAEDLSMSVYRCGVFIKEQGRGEEGWAVPMFSELRLYVSTRPLQERFGHLQPGHHVRRICSGPARDDQLLVHVRSLDAGLKRLSLCFMMTSFNAGS